MKQAKFNINTDNQNVRQSVNNAPQRKTVSRKAQKQMQMQEQKRQKQIQQQQKQMQQQRRAMGQGQSPQPEHRGTRMATDPWQGKPQGARPPERRNPHPNQNPYINQSPQQRHNNVHNNMQNNGNIPREAPQNMAKKHKPKHRITQIEMKRRKKLKRLVAIIFIILLVVVGLVLSINVFFKINDYRIDGDSIYTKEEYVDCFNVALGENIFSFNSKKKEKAIFEKMPYVETVKVRRRLPSTVVIKVTAATESYAVACDDGFWILSQGLKVLSKSTTPPENCCIINGIGKVDAKVGKTLKIKDEKETALLKDVMTAISKTALLPLTALDITDEYNINFVSNNRLNISLGTTVQLDYKLGLIDKVVAEKLTAEERVNIDASSAPTNKMVVVSEWL